MHLLTSSLLLVADGAADCLDLAAQRDDVVNWPVLTIVVRPVLEIARSLGVRPPARSRARRSSPRCELCGLATTIGQDPTRISTPARRTVGRSARNIVYPRRIPHPQGPSTKRNGNADSKSSMQRLPESRSPDHWPEPVKPVPCHSPRHYSASPATVPMTPRASAQWRRRSRSRRQPRYDRRACRPRLIHPISLEPAHRPGRAPEFTLVRTRTHSIDPLTTSPANDTAGSLPRRSGAQPSHHFPAHVTSSSTLARTGLTAP